MVLIPRGSRFTFVVALLVVTMLRSLTAQRPPQARARGDTIIRRDTAAPAQPEPSGAVSPEGWLGLALQCVDCGWMRSDRSATPVWYGGLPTVAAVEPGGPAARAGLAPGDVLVEVFGRSILERDSRQRFGALRPGGKITFTVFRHGTREPITVTAQERPDRASPSTIVRDTTQALRYSGAAGDAHVDVWSRTPVTVDVDAHGDLIVRTETSTVRVHPPKGQP